ncbi:MAG: hypothetical protein M1819_003045 [Sarea resinae]|nr:MAG: hypothetical protein M1819_003045 [Sarea resinae]
MNEPSSIDCYAVLGIEKDATHAVIKRAFHELALKYHPDKAGPEIQNPKAEFIKIHRAREILLDDAQRYLYDLDHFFIRAQWQRYYDAQSKLSQKNAKEAIRDESLRRVAELEEELKRERSRRLKAEAAGAISNARITQLSEQSRLAKAAGAISNARITQLSEHLKLAKAAVAISNARITQLSEQLRLAKAAVTDFKESIMGAFRTVIKLMETTCSETLEAQEQTEAVLEGVRRELSAPDDSLLILEGFVKNEKVVHEDVERAIAEAVSMGQLNKVGMSFLVSLMAVARKSTAPSTPSDESLKRAVDDGEEEEGSCSHKRQRQ